uniref:Large ribosomal subunit protein bL34m n=1 Tax=Anas zonorhyncha TaxID=75864 RepID=A0A8B9UHW2_9AVES
MGSLVFLPWQRDGNAGAGDGHSVLTRNNSAFRAASRCYVLCLGYVFMFMGRPAQLPLGLAGPVSSWSLQQVRLKARGNEYQPNNRKRKRTHGWIKRISTPGGIEVILRRMLKGRKSLSH